MRELIPTIVAMNAAVEKARASVDDHISKLIDEVLERLEEEGFPYGDALDIATGHVLFQQCSWRGKQSAAAQVEGKLKLLMLNEDFAA